MRSTDQQVRRLMSEYTRSGKLVQAAMKSGMSENTARKYVQLGKLPSEIKTERGWRTRPDGFADVWPEVAKRLRDAPELEAKALFEHLCEQHTEGFQEGQLRTFQRRVRKWRAEHGPDKEVFFSQCHRPGEALQTDWTWATKLEITIGGEEFPHMLCHSVLPFSNWQWCTVCRSESFVSLKRQVQTTLRQLGRVPRNHQTDSSTAATHDISGRREFNEDYVELMKHLGLKPRTIAIGKKEQNGDVESLGGALKRRLHQHLLLRGSRDFESVEAYERWVQEVLRKANLRRTRRLQEDLANMRPFAAQPLPEYVEERVPVRSGSTIRVKGNTYSVPSRLIGEEVCVRIYDAQLAVHYGGTLQLEIPRLLGKGQVSVDYRHLIWSLVRKPGAFARYRYREQLFPSLAFRQTYDALHERRSGRRADLVYLRILHLAASTMETEVQAALELLLEEGHVPDFDSVKALVANREDRVPDLAVFEPDLSVYDSLLKSRLQAVS